MYKSEGKQNSNEERSLTMRLKATTDYAIKLLLFLAMNPSKWTADDLCVQVHIPKATVIKIMQTLKALDWVVAFEGMLGGYMILEDPKQITLRQVFDAMEDLIYVYDRNTSALVLDTSLLTVYSRLQNVFEDTLNQLTLWDLLGMCEDLRGVETRQKPAMR